MGLHKKESCKIGSSGFMLRFPFLFLALFWKLDLAFAFQVMQSVSHAKALLFSDSQL